MAFAMLCAPDERYVRDSVMGVRLDSKFGRLGHFVCPGRGTRCRKWPWLALLG